VQQVSRRHHRRDESGYVAILTAVLLVPLIGMAAFAVDLGHWYVTARDVQRAADAAALGGVPHLPADPGKAFAAARALTADNGFADAGDVTVTTAVDEMPSQLRVTVSKKVPSHFGALFGVSGNTITRTAVADYAGPVPLGSPCNFYGNAPDSSDTVVSDVCKDVGQFWGNIGSPKATKVSGDAFQNNACASGVDGCVTGKNVDYDPNGYFYSVTLTEDVHNLVIEAFDPALVHVGDLCDKVTLTGAAGTRYEKGKNSAYCTGDVDFGLNGNDKALTARTDGYAGMVGTSYTVRDPGPNVWDPASFPARTDCEGTGTYPGFAVKNLSAAVTTDPYVAKVFRQWVPLCTIRYAPAGTYLVQMKTNEPGFEAGNGHNRFALRAYSTTNAHAKDVIAISGYSKMAMYANLPGSETEFYLARVPSGAANHVLKVNLFDVGDSTKPGTIGIVAPPDSGVTFSDCRSAGVNNASMPTCELHGVNSKYNGKWQSITVPIPEDYTCDDLDPTACWVRLKYDYGSGSQPSDTTSWGASLEGAPVRLIE
jgi:hypothetical protein